MELTGEAKEAFDKWLDNYSQKHHQKEWLNNDLYLDEVYLPDEIMNALIIEWLDSVGIYVGITPDVDGEHSDFTAVVNHTFIGFFPTRQQATEKAIERAVYLFNGK